MLFLLVASLCLIGSLSAQTRNITGKVTDAAGLPLPNVSVLIKGTNTGTSTAFDGTFSIAVPASARELVFSSVGLVTQEVSIGNRTDISAVMNSNTSSMEEVVVVGYGTQRRGEVTGSVATVKGTAIANKPVQSFDQALGGRAAGVQITIPSGVLNAPPVFRIRGTNSISLSSYPLIVIDGVPVYTGDVSGTSAAGNALSSINPNDIESIDIAKDAAASAIYGSRAANGVVFITTKKGKAGRSRVSIDSWVGLSQVQRLPDLLDAFQYTDYKNEALRNANLFSPTNQFALTDGPDGKPINTNWYDYAYQDGLQHSNSLSVSGGNDATTYYMSASYTDQQGIIKRNEFKRMSVLLNLDHKAGKWFTVGTKLQYSNEHNKSAVSSGSLGDAFATAGLARAALVTAPNISPYNNDGTYNYSGALIGVMNNKQGQVGFNNPVIQLDQNRGNSEIHHILANGYVQIKPVSWATFRSVYGLDYILVDNDTYYSPISGEGFGSNGSVTAAMAKNKRWVWTNTIQFDRTFGDKHNVSLLGGIEQQKSFGSSYGLNRINVSDAAFRNIQGGWATPNTSSLGIGENYLYSEFGRLQYNFDSKYFITGNIRRDGASSLGASGKYGTFYGLSAGWEITKEGFWENSGMSDVFSTLRLRASYGKVGNIAGLGNYNSLSTFGSGLYGGAGTVVFNSAGNPNLSWETSRKSDIGFSYGFLNDRITGDFAYYHNDVDDLILNVPQPPSSGLPNDISTNVGAMYNKGIEFSVSAMAITKKNFNWTSSFNITTNKNEVKSLAPGITNIISSTGGLENPSITVPGSAIGMIFVTRTKGVDPATGRRIFINKDGREVFFQHLAPAGQFRFSYADGTVAPTVSSADAVVYKNTNPKIFGGFDNTFRFGNFELSTLITYQFGGYTYFGTQAGLRDQRFWNNEVGVLNRWQKSGDVTEFPKPIFGDNISNGSSFPLDINVFKSDFIKLRTVTVAYNLPQSLLSRVKMNGARIYVTGNNFAMITDYPGPDPEVSSNGNGSSNFGVDRNTVGNARTFIVGLNLSF